jgi:hypothetical protein
LAIDDRVSNIIHEFRRDLGILVASRVTCTLDAVRYASGLAFDSFHGTGKDSMED